MMCVKQSSYTKVDVTTSDKRIIPAGGLAAAGVVLSNCDLQQRLNELDFGIGKRSCRQIGTGEIAQAYIGMLCMGKPAFEAVNEFSDDKEFYRTALGIERFPSEETLRQRLNDVDLSATEIIRQENIKMLLQNGAKPTPLANGLVPLDIDVTPFDNSRTHKEGVSRTYKGFDGYSPIMAYLGAEGYLICTELREGKQHCQNNTPEFLRTAIALSYQMTDLDVLVRLDSGNDAQENVGIMYDLGCYFIVKRNQRSESKDEWLKLAKDESKDITEPREGKKVYLGNTLKWATWVDEEGTKHEELIPVVYEVIERTSDVNGQLYLIPDIEVSTYWTNTSFTDKEVIELYHAHGEMEQFHSEIKSDMDVERLPSSKFKTNDLVLQMTMISYNILRLIGQRTIGINTPMDKKAKKVHRRRIRTVIGDLIMIPCQVIQHSRKLVMDLGQSNPWRGCFMTMYKGLMQA